MTLIIDVVI